MQENEYMVSLDPPSEKITLQSCLYTPKEVKEDKDNPILCIITHPYSLWGGSMYNNVVVGVRKQLVKEGFHCIAFNFRGVGKSTGNMGDGTEEQEDLIAICDFARKQLRYTKIFIIGYSYGGLVSLAVASDLGEIKGMCLISYPTGFVDHLAPDFNLEIPILLIHGKHDDIIPLRQN